MNLWFLLAMYVSKLYWTCNDYLSTFQKNTYITAINPCICSNLRVMCVPELYLTYNDGLSTFQIKYIWPLIHASVQIKILIRWKWSLLIGFCKWLSNIADTAVKTFTVKCLIPAGTPVIRFTLLWSCWHLLITCLSVLRNQFLLAWSVFNHLAYGHFLIIILTHLESSMSNVNFWNNVPDFNTRNHKRSFEKALF